MVSKVLIQLLSCVTMTIACGEVKSATLVFSKHVEVTNDRIRLADIAGIEDAGEDATRLAAVDLGNAPALGRVETLKAEQVIQWVRRRMPQATPIEWRGAHTFEVRAAVRVAPPMAFVEKAQMI